MASNQTQRSALKEFLASISAIKGDLSNITAPPFLLASQSTVEFPAYWAENPAIFVAPASEPDPEKRSLLVLRWFLAALKRQQYAGRDEKEGVKKPLNAFLGELFLAEWQDGMGETKLISEQVSHHPPITACYLWNDRHGVRAEGYACQNITFSGTVNIKQIGHAIVHLDKYNEDYLIPLPRVKVSGLITGTPYPELTGSYEIVSSTGYVSEIDFTGKKMLGMSGEKNHVHAAMFGPGDRGRKSPLYQVEGNWNQAFTITDVANKRDLETFNTSSQSPTILRVPPVQEQDPWESRRAWAGVIDALNRGDMQATSDAKSRLEQAQREWRKNDQAQGRTWQPKFFVRSETDTIFQRLATALSNGHHSEDALYGFWRFSPEQASRAQRPFYGDARPDVPS